MTIDHGDASLHFSLLKEQPVFLRVKPGDLVVVKAEQQVAHKVNDDWWMGQVVFCEGGARDPRVNTMFQISNVDDGCIYWVNADQVSHVLDELNETPT